MERSQKRYTKLVEAYLIKCDRYGGTHKPDDVVDATLLIVDRLDKMLAVMTSRYDVERYQVGSVSIVLDVWLGFVTDVYFFRRTFRPRPFLMTV